jgi:hypothetical protein
MIKYNELKVGDYVLADFDGDIRFGEVTAVNWDERQACIATGLQEFWFTPEQLQPIPLTDQQLKRLQFVREDLPDGRMKYKKGAFRMMLPAADDFSAFEIWYREEHRQILHPIHVHELQNHFLAMTKVHLTTEAYEVA